ncbi:uncharacterized protein F4807DRAFT_437607 [Annulohypoxylon truncatum]|uniref:uncharacterized protein n=1 Tax=Annulohypoxylon truncatum TaxID=327061 RepID=UPI002007C5D0|nr:uncharacterized protein F4807DRAFT_437607 [Annulohypoxylon truncatum]KAI1206893.1 hypothetical protein F4807DRAFT_437607 [Annulohypoxylon truncatum]
MSACEAERIERHRRRRVAAQLKRELSTCMACHEHRIKCDNDTPACGYCQFNGEECLYADTLLGIARLSSSRRRCARLATGSNAGIVLDKNVDTLVKVDLVRAEKSAYETILQWPFLRDLNVEGPVKSFPLQAPTMQGLAIEPRDCAFDLELHNDISSLCETFLRFVHVRNPIIGISEFRRYAREVDEHGPGWDGPGCFILLACALAKLGFYGFYADTAKRLIRRWSSFIREDILYRNIREANAEKFFNEAQRRLGILPNSLIAIQCTYLAGLYEQSVMRPLDAWHRFHSAIVRLQTSHHLYPNSASQGEQGDGRIDRCLYWLCIKAELELRAELQLPVFIGFSLFNFKHPKPAWMIKQESSAAETEFPPTPGLYDYHEAEIRLRGIMNHAINDLYNLQPSEWLSEITKCIRICAAYSEELESWREDLHPLLNFPPPISETSIFPNVADSMLAILLQVNYLSVIELLHRPFIYCILERGEYLDATDHPLMFPLARQYLDANNALIKLIAGTYLHHESTWTLVRRSFGCSLILLAAVRYNFCIDDFLELPEDWRTVVSMSMGTIKRWERPGAEEFPWMRRTLEHLLEVVEK